MSCEHFLTAFFIWAMAIECAGIGMQQLESAMQRAAGLMSQHGWPVPSGRCWKVAVGQASRAATTPDFAFRDLVRCARVLR
jgi:hypothetical protein